MSEPSTPQKGSLSQESITRETFLSPSQKHKLEKRLIITNIILHNFKSYYGTQEIGPLHHCFSAIVGPNGSGKSNVIDAILFVFGKQAKQLRLGSAKELIHNSAKHKNLNHAKVEVHFQSIVNTTVCILRFQIERTAIKHIGHRTMDRSIVLSQIQILLSHVMYMQTKIQPLTQSMVKLCPETRLCVP